MHVQKLNNFVGQEQIKSVIGTLIASAKLTNTQVKHFVLTGPQGYGKTTIAKIVSEEIGSNLFTINCCTLVKPKQILSIIENSYDKDVIFLEECHSIPKKIQEYLYTIMENNYYCDEYGNQVVTPNITIIGATTNIGLLTPSFRARFNFCANFIEYNLDELTEVCTLVCKSKGFTLNNDISQLIAKTCRNTPRIVVNRSNWVYDYMTVNKIKSVNHKELLDIIALQGINPEGLDYNDISYLKSLSFTPTSLNCISSKIGVDKIQIQNTIEPYMLKLGLIHIATKGRSLTRQGADYVKTIK